MWHIVAAVALAACASSCWGERPLRRPKERDAGRAADASDAVIDSAANALGADAVDAVIDREANAVDVEARDAVIDREASAADMDANTVDADASADLLAPGVDAADAPTESVACTGVDQPCCGTPGLPCCRGDCWIGVCAYTDAPRFCVACGKVGQPCCRVYTEQSCESGAKCQPAPGAPGGVCAPAS